MRDHVMSPRALRPFAVAATVLLMACAPGAAGASGALAGVLLLAGMLALLLPGARVKAGAPMPCQGYEETTCEGTNLVTHCCPQGAKCNFRDGPYVSCGHGTCKDGNDIGSCGWPAPHTTPAKSEAECKKDYGSWELVCANKVVAAACLPAMPTNFSGPGYNPSFTMCGKGSRLMSDERVAGERCTTHVLPEECYPTKAELGADNCAGKWVDLCIGGKVTARCLPTVLPWKSEPEWAAKTFVKCDDGSCAVGADKARVCRR